MIERRKIELFPFHGFKVESFRYWQIDNCECTRIRREVINGVVCEAVAFSG